MPKESRLEFKVGLFVLSGLVVLTYFIFTISDSSMFEERKTLKVVFGFANGLKKTAPVRIAGVDEGIVNEIKLFFDRQDSRTKAEVELWIKKDTRIPEDSVITINQLGLLGEKYIEVIPGTSTEKFLDEGQILVGKDPISQEAISERVMELADRIENTIKGVNEGLLAEENIESLSQTFKNIDSMTTNIDDILSSVKDGKGTVGKLFTDENLYNNLEAFTADIKDNPWKLLYRPKGRDKRK